MSKRIIFIFTLVVLFAISCEEQNEIKKQEPPSTASDLPDADPLGRSKTDPLVTQSSTCGGSYSGTYTTISSYYTYPAHNIDVTCAATGATITVFFDAVEIPNKFTVRDGAGNIVGSSGGWRGYASYGGPWGSSLAVSTTGSFSFTKSAGVNTYYLYVETLTPPNYSYNPNTDAWSASASCVCTTCSPACATGFTCQNGNCVCATTCGGGYNGTYGTIASYYTYPARTIDLTCARAGSITVYYDAVEIPNYFYVKDANGNVLGSSGGWRGYASYGGPWGSSLSVSPTGTFTFTKTAGVNTYYLWVQTLTPPNNSYNPNTDAWSASVGCPQ
jgi:hypothetical protein